MTRTQLIYPEVDGPDRESSPALAALVDSLLQKYGNGVNGVLIYGSCLRSGDLYDGLVDLYLVVDSYRAVYQRLWQAVGNWLLPPNVFYAEVSTPDGSVRAKYAIVSGTDFHRGTSRRWFESYLWGRFAQPTRIVFARDEASRNCLQQDLRQAVCTYLGRAIPACPSAGSVSSLWRHSLALSYRTELRSESSGRADELVDRSLDYFQAVTEQVSNDLPYGFATRWRDGNLFYRTEVPLLVSWLASWQWRLRTVTGKLLTVMRLFKALFTFAGGLDYIAWKLERHSGQRVEIPDKVRRHPLIHIWGFAWRLHRQGIFK